MQPLSQRFPAQPCPAVPVAASHQQQGGPKGQAEDHGPGQVRLVHDAAIGHLQGVQHR